MSGVEKFLGILKKIYLANPIAFKAILPYRTKDGNQIIIGLDKQAILDSVRRKSKSTEPRKVPSTDCWAQTNSSNPQKEYHLRRVMNLLQWNDQDIQKMMKLW